MSHINFKTTPEEQRLITAIVDRAVGQLSDKDKSTLDMDITACHCNGCPLDLERLLKSEEADFGHDVFGINWYVNRATGKLENNFHPRCAR